MTHVFVRPGNPDPRRRDLITMAILSWHVGAEEFDRTLPGEWMNGEWIPEAGLAFSASLKYARDLERQARAFCRQHGVTKYEWHEVEERIRAMGYREKKRLRDDMRAHADRKGLRGP